MDLFTPSFTQSPYTKPMINIGGGFDIPTGSFVAGRHGEHVLNGGLASVTGVVGLGNQFKSTMMQFMIFRAMIRIMVMDMRSTGNMYDTEINVHISRLKMLMASFIQEMGWSEDLIDSGKWTVTDKSMHLADEWYDLLKDWLQNKRKNQSTIMVQTPFLDRDGTSLMMIPVPTFGIVDSFSEFVGSNPQKMADDYKLGDAKANTLYMKQGQDKARFLMEVPALCAGAMHYMGLTAHMGQKIEMDPYNPTPKQLQHLANNLQIKGATGKFTYLTSNTWWCSGARVLQEEGAKDGPLYPRDTDDKMKLDPDLNELIVRNLRGKSGLTGLGQTVLVSQREGILPSLTEFHYIRSVKESDSKKWGIGGNNINYYLDLLPEVKLGRTTVRGKIDGDPVLRRALNITSEMSQMEQLWSGMDQYMMTPAELFTKVKEKGYEWNTLLNTRGWWTLSNDDPKHVQPFLSTMDLLLMAKGEYHPFWLESDNKTLKKEYQK